MSAGLGAARRRGSQGQEGGGDEEAGQVRLEGPLPPVDGKGGPRPRRATVRVFSAKSRDPIFTFNPLNWIAIPRQAMLRLCLVHENFCILVL